MGSRVTGKERGTRVEAEDRERALSRACLCAGRGSRSALWQWSIVARGLNRNGCPANLRLVGTLQISGSSPLRTPLGRGPAFVLASGSLRGPRHGLKRFASDLLPISAPANGALVEMGSRHHGGIKNSSHGTPKFG